MDLDILKGVIFVGRPRAVAPMEIEKDIFASATKTIQAPPKPTTTLPPLATEASPFEGLTDEPPEPIGVQFILYIPSLFQHMISTLVLSLLAPTEIIVVVHLVNEAFRCLSIFNVDLRTI